VSRRFVARTEQALAEMMAADLSSLDLVALMFDGVHFGEHCCVVGLGIGIDGTKHPLGVVEGSTENATVVTELLTSLRDRGLDVTRPVLVTIDGAKALAAAVKAVFDQPVIHRCQLHKIRNVENKLPKSMASTVTKKMRAAYRMDNVNRPGIPGGSIPWKRGWSHGIEQAVIEQSVIEQSVAEAVPAGAEGAGRAHGPGPASSGPR